MSDPSAKAHAALLNGLQSGASPTEIAKSLLSCLSSPASDAKAAERASSGSVVKRKAQNVLIAALLDAFKLSLEEARGSSGGLTSEGALLAVSILQVALVARKLQGLLGLVTSLIQVLPVTPLEALPTLIAGLCGKDDVKQALRALFAVSAGNRDTLDSAGSFNTLTKRLPRGDHAALIGQTYIWLASVLPRDFKPAFNLVANPNVRHAIKVDEVAAGATDSLGEPVNVDVYKAFWGLVSVLQNVKVACCQPDVWLGLKKHVGVVLEEFAQTPARVTSKVALQSLGDDSSALYLSSPSLLRLQIQDATFRRHLLVQTLIVLHQIKNPGKELQSVTPAAAARQKAEILALEPQVVAALRATPEKGDEFTDAVLRQLEVDKLWVAWKNPPRGVMVSGLTTPIPKAVDEAIAAAEAAKKQMDAALASTDAPQDGATSEWAQLWGTAPEDNMTGLDMKSRGLYRSLDETMMTVVDQMDETHPFYDAAAPKVKDDGVFRWRVLRMLVRHDVRRFATCINKKQGDLEWMASEMFPDHPASLAYKAAHLPKEDLGKAGKGSKRHAGSDSVKPAAASAGPQDAANISTPSNGATEPPVKRAKQANDGASASSPAVAKGTPSSAAKSVSQAPVGGEPDSATPSGGAGRPAKDEQAGSGALRDSDRSAEGDATQMAPVLHESVSAAAGGALPEISERRVGDQEAAAAVEMKGRTSATTADNGQGHPAQPADGVGAKGRDARPARESGGKQSARGDASPASKDGAPGRAGAAKRSSLKDVAGAPAEAAVQEARPSRRDAGGREAGEVPLTKAAQGDGRRTVSAETARPDADLRKVKGEARPRGSSPAESDSRKDEKPEAKSLSRSSSAARTESVARAEVGPGGAGGSSLEPSLKRKEQMPPPKSRAAEAARSVEETKDAFAEEPERKRHRPIEWSNNSAADKGGAKRSSSDAGKHNAPRTTSTGTGNRGPSQRGDGSAQEERAAPSRGRGTTKGPRSDL